MNEAVLESGGTLFCGESNRVEANYPDYARLATGEIDVAQVGHIYLSHLRDLLKGSENLVTDKMPHNFLNVGMIRLALPAAKIIHCRRDPRDTCLSIYFHNFVKQLHRYSYDLTWLGRYYRMYEDLMAYWHSLFPGAIWDIHYEDLVEDVRGQAEQMLTFCGLSWDDSCLDSHRSSRFVKTASRDQVVQPVYKNSVGRWRMYEPWLGPLFSSLGEKNGI